jgi:radical SAM enzyme (TIGR04100 family)
MVITYELYGALYLNITNRCTNSCKFCIRNTKNGVGEGIELWLEREPSTEEIIADIEKRDMSSYKELVFCGYGEPMIRLFDILEVCKYIKNKYNIKIRINTNGQANLIYGKDITPMLKDYVDTISISLNAKNAEEYDKACRSQYGEAAFGALLDFAVKCKKYVPEVILSVVDVMGREDIEVCHEIAKKAGVNFRVRNYSG